MEVGGCLCLIPIFVRGNDKFDINQYFWKQKNNRIVRGITISKGDLKIGEIILAKNYKKYNK